MAKSKAKRRVTDSKGARKSKLDLIAQALQPPTGVSIQALVKLTGWQPHSVRGALSGALRARGLSIMSEKANGVRRYRLDKSK